MEYRNLVNKDGPTLPLQSLSSSIALARSTSPKNSLVSSATNFHSIADLVCDKTPQYNGIKFNEDDNIDTQSMLWSVKSKSPEKNNSDTKNTSTDSISSPTEDSTTPRHQGNGCSDNRGRKGRTIYKAQQVFVLEQVFSRTHYPDPDVIETLSKDLDISENKIKVWFQNKRARWRRRVAEIGQPLPNYSSLNYLGLLPPAAPHPYFSHAGGPLMPHHNYVTSPLLHSATGHLHAGAMLPAPSSCPMRLTSSMTSVFTAAQALSYYSSLEAQAQQLTELRQRQENAVSPINQGHSSNIRL